MSLSDRIAVMFDGQLMGFRDPEKTDERELGLMMAGMTGKVPAKGRPRDGPLAALGRCRPCPASSRSSWPRSSRPSCFSSIGQSPVEAFNVMVDGALGSAYGWGYTLYYATSFIFTGLAVTVAFHAGLFNIGGEGQAQLGGLGVALVCLFIPWPHWTLALGGCDAGCGAVRGGLGGDPGLSAGQARQPYRHHHDHVQLHRRRLLIYLLVDVLRPPGQMDPATARTSPRRHLPTLERRSPA